MKTTAFLLTMLVPAVVSAQQKPTTGYAPVNGLKMYYEVHGSGDPLVLLHGAFGLAMDLPALAKNRRVIADELQGHGHTADIDRPLSVEQMADDTAALLNELKIERADFLGFFAYPPENVYSRHDPVVTDGAEGVSPR